MQNQTVSTSPPAKLNLFLEIPAKRDDGFHEIDTVMVAIDWRDELTVRSTTDRDIRLICDWLPSTQQVASELGLQIENGQTPEQLRIPTDESNLVVRALSEFQKAFEIQSGFRSHLYKRIPAGAGMGGASSDAAHAIRCAAHLHQIPQSSKTLGEIAASIGSDVPFFLEPSCWHNEKAERFPRPNRPIYAAHAGGRGELLSPLSMSKSLDFVVAYPNAALSTALVYQKLKVPLNPVNSAAFIEACNQNDQDRIGGNMMNRLYEPALEILPRLGELMESLWQSGLQPCQLTGSGSACYGIAKNAAHAKEIVKRLSVDLQPGVMLRAAKAVSAAAPIEMKTI